MGWALRASLLGCGPIDSLTGGVATPTPYGDMPAFLRDGWKQEALLEFFREDIASHAGVGLALGELHDLTLEEVLLLVMALRRRRIPSVDGDPGTWTRCLELRPSFACWVGPPGSGVDEASVWKGFEAVESKRFSWDGRARSICFRNSFASTSLPTESFRVGILLGQFLVTIANGSSVADEYRVEKPGHPF